MLDHLLTSGPAPAEYIEHMLMDRYKWTLSETRAVPLPDGLQLITVMGAEARAQRLKAQQ